MKKIISILLCLFLAVSFASCKVRLPDSDNASSAVPSVSSVQSESSEDNRSEESAQPPQSEDNSSSSAPQSAPRQTEKPTVSSAPSETASTAPQQINSCKISINCKTVLDNMDKLNPDKRSVIPADGIMLPEQSVALKDGDTVFDVLNRVTRKNRILMESSVTPAYGSRYIEGIGNLYEFDCGESSGWLYSVNGEFPNTGVSTVKVKNGDVIEFIYTCRLGDTLK